MAEPTQTGNEAPGRRIWRDGELIRWADATVHLLSHSMQRGSLVFDFMSVHATPRGPAVFRMAEHLERFARSCELIGLTLPHDAAALSRAICETVRANPGAKVAKICAYLPSIEIDVVPDDPDLSIAIAAYDPAADIAAHKRKPTPKPAMLRLWLEKEKANRREDIVPPQAKVAANYAHAMTAKLEAKRHGYDEILLVDDDGMVAEGPTTNVFIVDAAGALRTPPVKKVLLGVTRSSILEIAKHDGYDVHEAPISPAALFAAKEVFLTGTTAGVAPARSVDETVIGDGEPGPVSLALRDHFARISRGEDPAFDHWLTPVDE